MANDTLFLNKAPKIMEMLIADFDLTVDQAAAIVGNLGHESAGFRFLQEIKPLVPGSRGGFGWAQWTGSRRGNFEAWVTERGFDPYSDEANYGFLKHELENSEAGAIPAVRAATSLEDAVRRFELAFERADKDHKGYASRERYARNARGEFLRLRSIESATPAAPADALLSFGMRGPQVKALQDALFELDYAVGKRDGVFAGLTRAAVLGFQADNDMQTTGLVDKATWDKLASAPPRPLSRERTTKTAKQLAGEGSNTVIQGNRTRVLGWITGIFGALGIGNGLVQAGGPAQTGGLTAKQAVEGLVRALGAMSDQTPGLAEAKQLVAQLQGALPSDASGLPIDLDSLTALASTLLPGVPSSVLAIAIGLAMRYFGNQVIQSRVQDHHDASNMGR